MTDPRMTPTNDAPVTVEPANCPFCGSDEVSHGHGYPGYAEGKHGIVQCHSCDAIMLGDEEDDAIRQWNIRLAALASAPAGDGTTVEFVREWLMSGDHPVSDWERQFAAAIDARPRAAVGERYTGQGFLTPASGLDEDGMCNEHGRQGCRACVDDLLAPLAEQASAMPYRDGVIRIIAEAGKLNEGGHADWSVHAEAFADMILALQSPPAKVEG